MAAKFKPCSVAECNGNAHSSARGSQGWCNIHYQRWLKHRDLDRGRFTYKASDAECSVVGCGKPPIKRNYCNMHYQRWRKLGSPTSGRNPNGSLLQWIFDHLDHAGDECLRWPFGTDSGGYGIIRYKGRTRGVHNLICEIVHGEKPSSMHETAHSCGNGSDACVHPGHLRWATPVENNADKEDHGTKLLGENVTGSKLSRQQVMKIRELLSTGSYLQKDLAAMFGVTKGCISKINLRTTWRWLDDQATQSS